MLDFKTLWISHPANQGIRSPCSTDGVSNFDNQCAVRMSECFSNAGVSTDTFKGQRCYPGHGHNQSHILRAEELAKWITTVPEVFGNVQKNDPSPATAYNGRTGIVFFLNFWGRGNQGDHIDLWNGKTLTEGGNSDYFQATAPSGLWFWDVA